MSRAFVKEDNEGATPRYSLPPLDDPSYPLASARALLLGAHNGDIASAEEATGHPWGDPRLVKPMQVLWADAQDRGDDRTEVLAARFLKAAGTPVDD